MFHICFAADERYIKYSAVLITSIVKNTNHQKDFKDFFKTNSINNVRGGGGFNPFPFS